MRFLLFIPCYFLYFIIVAQNPQATKTLLFIDSLKKTLPKNYPNLQNQTDTLIAKKYYLIGENYLSLQADSTLLYAEKCLKIFENIHHSNTKITIYSLFGRAYGRKNKQDDRLKYLNKALELAEKLQDKKQNCYTTYGYWQYLFCKR
jgi:tetratricopeptide (TPR) repeat protein